MVWLRRGVNAQRAHDHPGHSVQKIDRQAEYAQIPLERPRNEKCNALGVPEADPFGTSSPSTT